MNLQNSLQQYINELSSNSPTPGGGNVAALCGALSASLGTMVCNLTIGKKKYAEVESEMTALRQELESFQKIFLVLAEKDNAAFDKVMEAFRMPKESDSEKEIRNHKIEEATLGAAAVPSDVMKNCAEILPLLKSIVEKGNKNSISDSGVAVSLIQTACRSAYLNVLINCASLNNQTIANEIRKRAEIQVEDVSREAELILHQVILLINQA